MPAPDTLGPQFSEFVNRVRQTGGATMNLRSGRLVDPGVGVYMVGGQTGKSGARIPTQKIPLNDFNEQYAQKVAQSLRSQKGGRGGNMGAWADEGNVEMDSSGITRRKTKALRNGQRRGEKEIWDNKNMRGIDTGGRAAQ
jgi:hypothetical protein